MSRTAIFGIFLLLLAPVAQAANIRAGDHTLQANTPGQVVDILIDSNPAEGIAGLDFVGSIGNNPLDDSPGSNTAGPVFTSLDIIGAESVFGPNNVGVDPGTRIDMPRLRLASTVTSSSTVPANGILARLVVDTSGVNPAAGQTLVFPLKLEATLSGAPFKTQVYDGTAAEVGVRFDGSLIIPGPPIPEPSTLVLLSLGTAGLASLGWRRRRTATR